MSKARRAEPLPPEARRQAIVEAVAPVLLVKGVAVTTRELAEAAGIAEGTLFSVFPDKRAILVAAIEHRMDPGPVCRGVRAIRGDVPLEEHLELAAALVFASLEEAFALFAVLHALPRPESASRGAGKRTDEAPAFLTRWAESVSTALVEILEPHRHLLRMPPTRVTALLLGMLFASRRPYAKPQERLSVTEIVDAVLHGVLRAGSGADPGPASHANVEGDTPCS